MTISRGQMNRQLYMGGGIMNAVPREQYGFGSIFKGVKNVVKKATGAVKDIASSDIGKAALIYGATAGLGALGAGAGRAGSGSMFGFLSPANAFANLGATGANIGSLFSGSNALGTGTIGSFLSGNKGKIAAGGLLASLFAGMSVADQADIDGADIDERGDIVAEKLRQSLTRLGYTGQVLEDKVAQGVSEYTGYTSKAEGGRIGYAAGSDDEFPLGDPTAPVNPFGPKPTGPVLPDRRMASNMENEKILEALFEKFLDMGLSPEKAAKEAKKEFERMSMMQTEGRGLAAMGGRMNYALGDTASQNAMQAAGIEGLPMRQNPKGVQELDLRDNGGFIPPVGIKEKEDDIPAMLSNNEFVFTADAVRGMGDGDVELGAQRMYDQMKTLEEGGRV